MNRGQREQTYRALQRRAEELEKLSKKLDAHGIDTAAVDQAILQTKAAIDDVRGQGNLFEPTPMEKLAQGPEGDSGGVEGDAISGPYFVRQDEDTGYEIVETDTGEIVGGPYRDWGPAKETCDRFNAEGRVAAEA